MKVFVIAKSSAKENRIDKVDEAHFIVHVKEPAQQGKANQAIAKTLARHLGISFTCIHLIRGSTSKRKVFEIG